MSGQHLTRLQGVRLVMGKEPLQRKQWQQSQHRVTETAEPAVNAALAQSAKHEHATQPSWNNILETRYTGNHNMHPCTSALCFQNATHTAAVVHVVAAGHQLLHQLPVVSTSKSLGSWAAIWACLWLHLHSFCSPACQASPFALSTISAAADAMPWQ